MTNAIEPSIRAVRRYQTFIEEIPRFWRPGKIEWQNIRVWSIDNDGRLSVVAATGLELPGGMPDSDRFFKDTLLFAAAMHIRRYPPAAVVLACEAWCTQQDDRVRDLVKRRWGRTPSLCEPENREEFERVTGTAPIETLIVHAEIHGQPVTHRLYTIQGEQLLTREAKDFDSRFTGLLRGEPQMILKDHR